MGDGMEGTGGYFIQMLVTLVAVCGLAFVILYGARRLGVGRAQGPIRLCGHLPLDARRAIYLVEVGEQVLVIGVGDGGFTKLGEVPAGSLASAPPASASAFRDVLARAIGRRP